MTAPQAHAGKLTLLSLPAELIVEILESTPATTLCRCKEVCRTLCQLIKETISLQYKLELAAADLVDAPPPGGHALAIQDRIRRISDYRRAWADFNLSEPRRFPIRGGAFHDTPQSWLFHPSGVLVERTEGSYLQCRRLATPLGGADEATWLVSVERVGGELKRFAVDPAQDLLVVITSVATGTRLAYCSLVTGKAHPLATEKVIEMGNPYRNTSSIRIQDDVVLVHGCSPFDQVWNWKKGVLVYRLKTFGRDQAAFLDSRSIAAVSGSALLSVHSFDDQPIASDGDLPKPHCELLMRRRQSEEGMLRAVFIGGQATAPHTSFCRLDPQKSMRIFACHSVEHAPSRQVHLCVPQATLLDCLRRTANVTGAPEGEPPLCTWDMWGALGQVAKPGSITLDWPQYSTCGPRVLVVRPVRDDEELELEVLEYAVPNVPDFALPGDKVASSASLLLNRRITRVVRCPEPFDHLRRAYLWENGVVIQGDEAVHIISFEI